MIRYSLEIAQRRKLLILVVGVIAGLVAGGISIAQQKSYEAQATIQALDPSQTAGYAELTQADVNVSSETAAQLAQTATQTAAIAAVKARLRLPDSINKIRSRLTLSEDQQSSYLLLDASAGTPSGAVALADTMADEIATVSNQAVRAHFAAVAARDNRSALALSAQYTAGGAGRITSGEQNRLQQATQLEQLSADVESFSKLVTVAHVASYASLPTSPSSPHPVTNFILGLVVGLVVGILLAWLLESLGKGLRRPAEVASILGLPVIGALQSSMLGNTTADEGGLAGMAAFRMLRSNVRFLRTGDGNPPRSILVTSALHEEGKSTVAIGLALAMAATGLNTLLIEADVDRPAVAKRLGLATAPGLSDYLNGDVSPAEILQVHRFAHGVLAPVGNRSEENAQRSRLACITAGAGRFVASELGVRSFAPMLSAVTQAYDTVVIDAGPLLGSAQAIEIATMADATLLCVRLGRTTAEQAMRTRTLLGRLTQHPLAIVLTDVQTDTGDYISESSVDGEPAWDRNRAVSASASGVPIS